MTDTLVPSNTNNASDFHLLASVAKMELELIRKEVALIDQESASPSRRKEPPLTMSEILSWAQEKTGTTHFPQLLPQKALSNEEIANGLAMHKASVDQLSQHFSVYNRTLDKTRPRHQGFLWEGRLPLGGLTLLNGAPGTDRSLLLYQIAAAVSSGGDLPDDTKAIQGGVVIVAPYANATTFLLPLLAALGADLSRIRIISYIQDPAPLPHTGGFRPLTLPEDFPSLAHAIEQVDARLVILDPFMSLLSRKQRWTNEHLGHLLTDLHQRMVERDVACILVRNCSARGSHTRPSFLERSDHFENIASSSLLLAPDPMHPNRLLLCHADSHASPLADTLTMQIQPLPNAPHFARFTVLESHPLKAYHLLEHRSDTLRYQRLCADLLSFINDSAAPIHISTLYTHFSPASSSQIQRALKDLLNTEQIERSSRGIYTPLNATIPTTLDQSPTDRLRQPAAITVVHPPTIKLTQPAAITSDPWLTNEFTESATTTLEPLPTNKLADAVRPSDPLPTNELTEYTAIPTEQPPTNELTQSTTTTNPLPTNELTQSTTTTEPPLTNELTQLATTTTEPPPKAELTQPATTTSEPPPKDEFTVNAATIAEPPPTNEFSAMPFYQSLTNRTREFATILSHPSLITELTQAAATATDPSSRTRIKEIAAILANPSLTSGPDEIAAMLSDPRLIYGLHEIAATASPFAVTNRIGQIACLLGDPSLTPIFKETATILFNTSVTNSTH